MVLVTTVKPTATPITLAEAKEQCRILSSDTTHDTLISRLIDAAVGSVETYTGSRLASQTVRLDLDGYPSGDIDLGVYPVNSISAFVYDDGDDVETAMVSGTDYYANLAGMYPYITRIDAWPVTKSGKPANVRITMNVGYASTDDVPDDIRHALLLRVQEYFANNGESVIGQSVAATVSTVKGLSDMHRRIVV